MIDIFSECNGEMNLQLLESLIEDNPIKQSSREFKIHILNCTTHYAMLNSLLLPLENLFL